MPRPKVDRVTRSIRLPRELDEKLADLAERDEVSVNQKLADLVTRAR